MAIKPPNWCRGAVPELNRGWVDPGTNELLVSSRFTKAQVDDFFGMPSFQDIIDMNQEGKIQAEMIRFEAALAAAAIVEEENEDLIADLNDDGVIDNLEQMTKTELEALGREKGLELDRRKSKTKLIDTLRGFLG